MSLLFFLFTNEVVLFAKLCEEFPEGGGADGFVRANIFFGDGVFGDNEVIVDDKDFVILGVKSCPYVDFVVSAEGGDVCLDFGDEVI